MKEIELLERAFYALKNRSYVTEYEEKLEKEISYYLLSTPEPTQGEPIAYWDTQRGLLIPAVPLSSKRTCFEVPLVPLYLHPPCPFIRRTDEEIQELLGPFAGDPIRGYTRKLFDEIQDKLEEKNK